MLGSTAVGKTSLVRRFITSQFSENYRTTVGVKIEKKELALEGRTVTLILWDLAGDDPFQELRMSYLRGACGYLLVVDGGRRATLTKAMELQLRVSKTLGEIPFVLILNKTDLGPGWDIDQEFIESLRHRGWTVITASAKDGEGVEEAFTTLTRQMLARPAGEIDTERKNHA